MLYLTALALIIALAVYLCARLFPRNHTTTRATERPHSREPQLEPDGNGLRATEGEQP